MVVEVMTDNIYEMNRDELQEFQETKLREFKELWLTTDLPEKEIFKKIGVDIGCSAYRWILGQKKTLGLTAKSREINFNIIEGSTHDDFEELYQRFKQIWLENPKISKKKAFDELGFNQTNSRMKYINERMKEDGLPEHYKHHGNKKKKQRVNKNIVDESEYESKYQEYKDLFENTDMLIRDIYKKIGVAQHNQYCGGYIQKRAKEDGLNGHKRKKRINTKKYEKNTEEYEKIFLKYQDYFYNTDYPIKKIYEELDIPKDINHPLRKYISKRSKDCNMDGRARHSKKKELDKDKAEETYQKFKDLYLNTDKKIKDIYKELELSSNSLIYKYVKDRQEEDGLKSLKRRTEINRKTKKESKPKPRQGYSDKAFQMVEDSRETLQKMYAERNISQSTKKTYEATFIKWCEYFKDRFNNLQEMIDFYLEEEDERIPMRERTLKKDLLEFREYLQNNDGIKSDRSFKTYFSKMKTIFNHFELEMPTLPQMKLEKGYISNYNDLPTHAMIKSACEQSPLDLKAVILFMSSSGSAKAETLSIEVGWFLEGCKEYLDEMPNQTNIQETLKALSDRHDIVPMIYLRRIKTDKWYYTYCSPEASYMIIESLKTRKNLRWDSQLFNFTSSLLLTKFQEINDNNEWGYVGSYRRFRSHALRKFMASNIGLARDQVDSIQGRSKDMIQEAYFKQDPKAMKEVYMSVMERVMIYNNWGYGTNKDELVKRQKRLFNDFKDDEKIVDLSSIPITPEDVKTSIGLGEDDKATFVHRDASTRNVNQNRANTMPVSAPVQVPVGSIAGTLSISEELLNYAKLMDMGLISIAEFNRIKQKLLGSMLI